MAERLPCRVRQRALATRSSGRCAVRRGRRLLGLAGRDARRGRGADARARPSGLRADLREMRAPGTRRSASSTTSAFAKRARPPRRPRGRDRARAPARGLRPRRARPLPAGLGGRVPGPGRGAARRRHRGSASPPTPSGLPRRMARGDRPLRRARGPRLHVHADEQPKEIEECLAEHGVRPIELLARSGLPRAADDDRPRHARLRRRARPARRGRRAHLRLPDDRGEPRRRLRSRRARPRPGDRPVHRLGLERADRPARGAPGARGHRAPAGASPQRDPRPELPRSARPRAQRRSGSTQWPGIEADLEHPSLAGVAEGRPAALVFGCGADVSVP